jgi:hypothetical protein
MRGVDPTPVLTINHLKSTIEENRIKEKILAELEEI